MYGGNDVDMTASDEAFDERTRQGHLQGCFEMNTRTQRLDWQTAANGTHLCPAAVGDSSVNTV